MTKGKNVVLFLIDGIPSGRIKCTLANWTGISYRIPMEMINNDGQSEYMDKTGIYFLIGYFWDSGEPVVQIGKAGIQSKLTNIHSNKVIWTEVVIFNSLKDSLLSPDIRYMKEQFCNIIKEADRYQLYNRDKLESFNILLERKSELDEFIEYIRFIMEVLGYKFLKPISKSDNIQVQQTECRSPQSKEFIVPESDITNLYIKRKEIFARGSWTKNGFVIFKGSRIAMTEGKSCKKNIREKRKQVFSDYKKVSSDGILKQDILFKTPSGAAGFVLAVSANGWVEWKNENGVTLNDLVGR